MYLIIAPTTTTTTTCFGDYFSLYLNDLSNFIIISLYIFIYILFFKIFI